MWLQPAWRAPPVGAAQLCGRVCSGPQSMPRSGVAGWGAGGSAFPGGPCPLCPHHPRPAPACASEGGASPSTPTPPPVPSVWRVPRGPVCSPAQPRGAAGAPRAAVRNQTRPTGGGESPLGVWAPFPFRRCRPGRGTGRVAAARHVPAAMCRPPRRQCPCPCPGAAAQTSMGAKARVSHVRAHCPATQEARWRQWWCCREGAVWGRPGCLLHGTWARPPLGNLSMSQKAAPAPRTSGPEPPPRPLPAPPALACEGLCPRGLAPSHHVA